jgi:hypothetical protein
MAKRKNTKGQSMELYFAELEPLILCRTRGEHVNHYAADVVCVFYMFSIYGSIFVALNDISFVNVIHQFPLE